MTLSGPNPIVMNLDSTGAISGQAAPLQTCKGLREVLFFAIASEIAKTRSVFLSLDENLTIIQVRASLITAFPALEPLLPFCALAMDGIIARDFDLLGPARTIAILPPVSGG